MNSFNLHTPTRILFGRGATAGLRERISHDARVLAAYGGGSVKKTGVLDQVLNALKGMDVLEFGGIEPNPAYETLINVVKLIHEQKVTFLLTVGNDPVLGGIKFTAAVANCPENVDPWHILQAGDKKIKNTIPMGCVLTLPTIGSESSVSAVISCKTTGDKQAFHFAHVQPVFAVLDSIYAYTLSSHQVANSVVDTFVYTVEQYIAKLVDTKIQDRFVEGILLTLIKDGPKALKEPENYDVHTNAMWIATQALSDLTGAGVPQDQAMRMLSHELTVMYGLSYAQALTIVLPALQNGRRETKCTKLLQHAEHVWSIIEGSDGERVDATVAATRNFFKQLDVPTHLSDYGLGGSLIPALLKKPEERSMTQLGRNHDTMLDASHRIYEATR